MMLKCGDFLAISLSTIVRTVYAHICMSIIVLSFKLAQKIEEQLLMLYHPKARGFVSTYWTNVSNTDMPTFKTEMICLVNIMYGG